MARPKLLKPIKAVDDYTFIYKGTIIQENRIKIACCQQVSTILSTTLTRFGMITALRIFSEKSQVGVVDRWLTFKTQV